MKNHGGFTGVYLSVHTPRYCTLEAAFAGKVAHPDFRAVRDGLAEQGRLLGAARPEVIVINSCHLVTTFPVVVDGTPRHRAAGDYGGAWAWLPEYAKEAEPEMGGRHLAMMLGVLVEAGQRFTGVAHAYGPSSGSGNYVLSLTAS